MRSYKATLMRSSLSRQVYQHLKQAIVLQEVPEFKMGTRINEAAIAKMFNCSVTPVRESINMLRRDGLIVGDSYQSSSIVFFGVADVQNLFDVRKYLEIGGLQEAFEKLTEQDIDLLWKSIDYYSKAYSEFDEAQIIQSNREFHNIILNRAGNELLQRMLGSITEQVAMARAPIAKERKQAGNPVDLLLPVREHRAILEAIERQDLEAAKARMCEHIDRVCRDSCHYYLQLSSRER